ncbi:uncharacterized protein LOC126678041 [Mercurialis annua]|uniref:uncharacterized protein LOC126678041 n=1 Tax=Mercurialis annua TaxID=3986 RepID=UPI002160310B|nr:uncharacterized protein LOC126678041 [Mercurialis annua]
MHQMKSLLFFLFVVASCCAVSIDQIKCGSCPCVNPCAQLPPPPPPPPPKTTYCSPVAPPPPRFIYVTGVPGNGNLYVTDENWNYFSGASTRYSVTVWLVGFGFAILHLIMIIW